MTYVYNEVFGMENRKIDQLIKNLLKDYRFSSATFQDADEEDQEFLKRFSFICLMSFDVYIKKMIIEKMIDDISPSEPMIRNPNRVEGRQIGCQKARSYQLIKKQVLLSYQFNCPGLLQKSQSDA